MPSTAELRLRLVSKVLRASHETLFALTCIRTIDCGTVASEARGVLIGSSIAVSVELHVAGNGCAPVGDLHGAREAEKCWLIMTLSASWSQSLFSGA